MADIHQDLERLKHILGNKGLDVNAINAIVENARREIEAAMADHLSAAMQLAIDEGVEKRSPDFINDLKLNYISMQLDTESGNMNFSEPPRPMLPGLLKNAKPMKDGSGVYKIIPIGTPGKNRPQIATNIYDAWKRTQTERSEASRAQRDAISPKGSKGRFATATSKQDSNTKWVQPAKDKDFTETVQSINRQLDSVLEDIISGIIRDYEESF